MTEFKITGLGEYRTRGGEKVVITGFDESTNWPWRGTVSSTHKEWSWDDLGFWGTIPFINDIIGPWVEPERVADAGKPIENPKTLRDEMALAALSVCHPASPQEIATYAYAIADAMMKEREAKP